VKEASDDVSQGTGPDPEPARLLIGYEHARCSTNTNVILPGEVEIDPVAFKPTVVQIAEQPAPTCPVCGTRMDFAIWVLCHDAIEGRRLSEQAR
jgi:hypothetical protein